MKCKDLKNGKKVDIEPKDVVEITLVKEYLPNLAYRVTMGNGASYDIDAETDRKLRKLL